MTQKNRLQVIRKFLTENNIRFSENVKLPKCKEEVTADLYVKKFGIAVHASDGKDQDFYRKVTRWYKPFFIRETESDDFILEKMQNCIIERMKSLHRQYYQKKR